MRLDVKNKREKQNCQTTDAINKLMLTSVKHPKVSQPAKYKNISRITEIVDGYKKKPTKFQRFVKFEKSRK